MLPGQKAEVDLVDFGRIEMFSNITSNLKRGSTVAVFALTLIGVTALPAQATGSPVNLIASATSVTPMGIVATQLAGVANYVTINDTVISGPSALPVYFTVTGGVTTTGTTSGTLLAGASVGIATTTAGTITVYGYAIVSGAASAIATDVITITVVGSVPGTVYASSQIYGEVGTVGIPTAATDAAFSLTAPSTATNVAQFSVSEFDSNGIPVFGANAKPIIVTVSAGLIASYDLTSPTAIPNTTYMSALPSTPTSHFLLSGVAGLAATSTVTFVVNGVTKVYKVNFTGTATRIVLTPINAVVGIGVASALLPSSAKATGITANTNAVEIQEFDSAGNVLTVNPGLITINSSAPGIAVGGVIDNSGVHTLGDIAGGVATSATVLGLSITGLVAGTTNLTAIDASSPSATSLPVSIRVSSGIPTAVVLTSDSNVYGDGAPGTLTTTLSDNAGRVPAGTYVVFTGQATASLALPAGLTNLPGAPTAIASSGGSIPTAVGQVTVKADGTYSSAFNAPVNDGSVTISANPATAAITVTPVTFSASSGNSAPEAVNESSSADNAATDAGALATTSADAADGAAQSASVKATAATALIAALTPQVTNLLATVISRATLIAKILKALKKK